MSDDLLTIHVSFINCGPKTYERVEKILEYSHGRLIRLVWMSGRVVYIGTGHLKSMDVQIMD